MRCSDFLSHFSDFRDGGLAPAAMSEMRMHLAECARCGGYQSTVGRGVELLRSVSNIQVPPGFSRRIAKTVTRAGKEPDPVMPARAGIAGAAMIAAALVLMVTGHDGEINNSRLSAPASEQRLPTTIAIQSAKPYLTFVDLSPAVLNTPYNIETIDTTRTLAEYVASPTP